MSAFETLIYEKEGAVALVTLNRPQFLNAYNIQIGSDEEVWLLDFDRGRLDPEGTWKQETLSRLHRSLQKVSALSRGLHYSESNWEIFLEGYFSESRSE